LEREKDDFKGKKSMGSIIMKDQGRKSHKRKRYMTNLRDLNNYIYQSVEELSKYELLALCQSYCSQKAFLQIDYEILLKDTKSLEQRKKIVFYFYSFHVLRQIALKKLCDGILEKGEIRINESSKRKTRLDHSEFKKLIADYLAYDIREEILTSFEEHLLACDYCGDFFLLCRHIVNTLRNSGEELLLKLLFNEKEIESEIEGKQIPYNIFVIKCVKKFIFEQEPIHVLEDIHSKLGTQECIQALENICSRIGEKSCRNYINNLLSNDIEDILRKYAKELLSKEKILSVTQVSEQSIRTEGESSCSMGNIMKSQKKDQPIISGKNPYNDQIAEDESGHEMNDQKKISPEKILLLCIFLPQFSILNRILMRILPHLSRLLLFTRNISSFILSFTL
jgi:hypothetical protein